MNPMSRPLEEGTATVQRRQVPVPVQEQALLLSTSCGSVMLGEIGVQATTSNGSRTVEKCEVRVAGDLRELAKQDDDRNTKTRTSTSSDMVQVFHFDQFTCPCRDNENESDSEDGTCTCTCTSCNLMDYMEQIKPLLESDTRSCCFSDMDSTEDSNEIQEDLAWDDCSIGYATSCTPTSISREDMREQVLLRLHDVFLPIVRQIIVTDQHRYRFYRSGLSQYCHAETNTQGSSLRIQKYAKPNLRNTDTHYANYLHNDAWITRDDYQETGKVAMINVWFVLNDIPPNNTLVFFETAASNTLASHMLHASPAQVYHQTVFHDEQMSWGSFYLFVAGQLDTSQRVLLHGAMELPSLPNEFPPADAMTPTASTTTNRVRQSVEMRYTVHT
jgi:hypothetical protein